MIESGKAFFDAWNSARPGSGKHRRAMNRDDKREALARLYSEWGGKLSYKELRFVSNFVC